jgi:hypothetical protein
MTPTEKLNKHEVDMLNLIKNFDINDVKNNKVNLRIGNVLYDLTVSNDTVEFNESEIRKEFESKINERLTKIREVIKNQMKDVSMLVSSIQSEFDRKEKTLKDMLSKTSAMPNITIEHARKGLSIFRGQNSNEIQWLVRRTYNPKFIDREPIEVSYVKKMMTNIYIMITTRDNSVIHVSSRYINSLDYFDHYHQVNPDCWGSWSYPKTWNDPNDIINIADQAVSVMENINTMSIAHRTPRLLPRLDTLRRHVVKIKPEEAQQDVKVTTSVLRTGGPMVVDDIWGN